MITLAAINPLAAAVNVPTGTTISFSLTSGSLITKTDISASVGAQTALTSQVFLDGVVASTSGTGLSLSGIIGLTATLNADQALFEAGDVGKTVIISGALHAANNGTFTVTTFTSSSQVILTRGGGSFVAETSSFTWVLNNSNIFSTFGSYTFTTADIGKSITISNSIVIGNNVEAVITSIVTPHRVRTNKPGGYAGGPPAETGLRWTLSGSANGFNVVFAPTSLTNLTYTVTITPPDDLLGSTVVPVHVAVSSGAITPPDTYSFTTSARPRVASANPVIGDPFGRNIRIYFDQPMVNNPALLNATNYVITKLPLPPAVTPTITAVVPEAVLNPTYVDLNLNIPMTNNGQYIVTVTNTGIFGSLLNDKLDVFPYNKIQFLGFGTVTQQSVFKDNIINTPIIEGTSSISFAPTKASLRWFPLGATGSLVFTAKAAGTYGNSLTVYLKDPGLPNQPLHLTNTGNNLIVYLSTNSAGAIVTRLHEIVTIVTEFGNTVDILAGGNVNSVIIPMPAAIALSGGAKMDTSAIIQIIQNDPTLPTLGSLDPDVVSITLGPASVGVVSISDFINNGDGSGTFKVIFSNVLTSYKLSIIAMDNVDNISLESNILSIEVLPETIPGLDLSIVPFRNVYSDVCDRLINDVPQSLFILQDLYTIPYTYDPFPFTLNIVEIGVPLYITVTQNSIENKPQSLITTHVPQALTEIVNLPLGRGRNYIFVTDGIRSAQIVVAATTYATVLCCISTEIFDYSRLSLDEVNESIFNDLATSLAEPYLPIYEVLPSVRPQQLLSMKLAIRSYISTKGQQQSVQDLVTAMTLQTPVINRELSDRVYFEPATAPLFNFQESFAGSDIHVWLHNTCASRWLGFIKYLRNFPDVFQLLSVDDSEVVFVDDVGITRKHKFNLLDPSCSTLDLGNFCFENTTMDVSSTIETYITMCAASYPMDLCFGADHPLGPRGVMDTGIPWDVGLPFDDNTYLSESYLDPGNDGWAGLCATPHWDSIPPLSVVPPREFDPILGEVVISGATVHGSGTHFLSYTQIGSRVYIRNENIAYTVVSIASDTQLLLNTPPPANPHSGVAGLFTHPVLAPLLGPTEYVMSGLTGLLDADLPLNTPVHVFGPVSGTGVSFTIPTDIVLDSGTGINIVAATRILTVSALTGAVTQIAVTSATTATLTVAVGLLTVEMVGKKINITGAANPTNNGLKLITSFINSTTVTLTDPVTFINEGAGASWAVDRFSPDSVGKIFNSTNVLSPNFGTHAITDFIDATHVKLGGTLANEVSAFAWQVLPARAQMTATAALFRASDVGRTVTVSGAVNSSNNGTHIITSVIPPLNANSLSAVVEFAGTFVAEVSAFAIKFNIEPIVGFVTAVPSVSGANSCHIQCPDFLPVTGQTFFWYIAPRTDLKLLSGTPMDSMADQPSDKLLGNVYILDETIPPQNVGQPEVPFYVTGLNTHFIDDIEVGFPVYFPDDPAVVYKVLAVVSDTRLQVVKTLPANTVSPPLIIPPHSKVIPVSTGINDATLTVDIVNNTLATFTAPYQLFTVPSVGKYINFPNKYGRGVALTNALGGTLTVADPTFVLSDSGKTVTISGAVNPGNNGVHTITYVSPTQVTLTPAILINEPAFPNNQFLWQLNDVTLATSKRLGKIVGLIGSAPTAQVLVSTVDAGSWVTSTNDFVWELLPDSILISEKADPMCVYEGGYATTLATLCSADADLSLHPIVGAPTAALNVSMTENVTAVNVDVSHGTIEVAGIAAGAGLRPYFLATDVGNIINISAGPNLGPYTITVYISPTKVQVSGVVVNDGPANRTWTLTNP